MSNCDTLFLVPSPDEFRFVGGLNLGKLDRVAQCGVGVVASAARSMQLLIQYRPTQVVLFGIAGTYQGPACMEEVIEFGQVAIWGIGASEVDDQSSIRSLARMGLQPLSSELPDIVDVIELEPGNSNQLLTVCSAAASERHVATRKQSFPKANAEDMEGFAVAFSCALTKTPLKIVRGISNLAGDRNHANWQVQTAMLNCVDHLNQQSANQPSVSPPL